jgi:hypothetical protein
MYAIRNIFQLITLAVAVACGYGFLPYKTVTITVDEVVASDDALNAVSHIVKDLGYVDAELPAPASTRLGFRSVNPRGLVVYIELDLAKNRIEISLSEYSTQLTAVAGRQFDILASRLKDHFKNRPVSISR